MKNIRLRQYTALQNTFVYDTLLEYLRPKNAFAGRQMEINTIPYANIKYCIRQLPKVNSWEGIQQLFEICFGADAKAFNNARITEYFAARKFMVNEFTRIIETESRALASQSTDAHLWKMAGADKLKPYSDTLPLIQLGKLLGQYPFDLGRKPYGEIFSLLVQTKAQNDVEAEYQRLSRQ